MGIAVWWGEGGEIRAKARSYNSMVVPVTPLVKFCHRLVFFFLSYHYRYT